MEEMKLIVSFQVSLLQSPSRALLVVMMVTRAIVATAMSSQLFSYTFQLFSILTWFPFQFWVLVLYSISFYRHSDEIRA